MKKIKIELSTIPLNSDPQQLMKIAEPIAQNATLETSSDRKTQHLCPC